LYYSVTDTSNRHPTVVSLAISYYDSPQKSGVKPSGPTDLLPLTVLICSKTSATDRPAPSAEQLRFDPASAQSSPVPPGSSEFWLAVPIKHHC